MMMREGLMQSTSGMRDEIMPGLLVLAAFSPGIFFAYALLGL